MPPLAANAGSRGMGSPSRTDQGQGQLLTLSPIPSLSIGGVSCLLAAD
ncbi:MAG: hypothetical protein O3A37_13100 [Planctomycetota bacterium]|nr:hypothetical protein [Planctomycetota bacterium]